MPKPKDWGTQLQVGVDVEQVERFRTEFRASSHFFTRTFTSREVKYCMSKADPPVHFAGAFAAKEAAAKAVCALTTRSMPVTSFEVAHRRDGVPVVRYFGKDSYAKKVDIKLSLSHTREVAMAVAIALLPTGPTS